MEKKNYCVDGECTSYSGDSACKYYVYVQYDHYCGYSVCDFYCFSEDQCKSHDANSEYQESQNSSDKYASIKKLTQDDRDEILEFALKRSAEMLEEE